LNHLISLLYMFVLLSVQAWGGANLLVESHLNESELKLEFNHPIKRVKHFIIPANGYTKYVYDIQGGRLPYGKTLHLKHSDVKAFRIGQYNQSTLRVVIESRQGLERNHYIRGKTLIIPIPQGKYLYRHQKKKLPRRLNHAYRIVIDAGHGGRDNGASCCSLTEKRVTLMVAKKLQRKLQAKGYRTYMTRTQDHYVSLLRRTEYANKKGADIFVSIHVNAAPKRKQKRLNGIEVYYLSLKGSNAIKSNKILYKGRYIYTKKLYYLLTSKKKCARSKSLGKAVESKMISSIRRGYKEVKSEIKGSDFWVLLGTKMPAILVETGYLTHKRDRKRLSSDYYQNLVVNGIVNGIDSYFKQKR